MKTKLTKLSLMLALAISAIISNNCSKDDPITAVQNVHLDKTGIPSLPINETVQLTTTVKPDNATDKEVKWSTSDALVASVDPTGLVTAVSGGTVSIKAQAGAKEAICKIIVPFPPIEIITESASMVVGGVQIATVKGQGNDKLTFSSSDTTVATVSEVGIITAVAAGKVKISATTANNKTAFCDITVTIDEVKVTSIKVVNLIGLDPTKPIKVSLVGETLTQIKTTVLPENATNKKVTFSSDKETIATVDKVDGYITPKAIGKATITITSQEKDSKVTATCNIEVINDKIPVASITVTTPLALNLLDGSEKIVATAKANPTTETPTNTKLSYRSLNTTIATVDVDGWVTPKVVGTTKIIITAQDGSGVTAECVVNVTSVKTLATGISIIKPTAISPALPSLSLAIGESSQIEATATTATDTPPASNSKVTFASLNSNIATVDSDGNVTAVAAGKTSIKIVPQDGSKVIAYCAVTVTASAIPVTGITLTTTSLSFTDIGTNNAKQIIATATPATATNLNLKYTSTNGNVATVDDTTGLVAPVGVGSTTITIISQNTAPAPNITKYCSVTVTTPAILATDITITSPSPSPSLAFEIGHATNGIPKQIIATATPATATNTKVTYSSLNTLVATVDANTGWVTPKAAGNTKIIITAQDGSGVTKEVDVTVTAAPIKVTGITLTTTSLIFDGITAADQKIYATATPTNAVEKALKYTSTNESVATVGATNGLVAPVAVGSTTIIITPADGSDVTKTCSVTVNAANVPVTGITGISLASLNIGANAKIAYTLTPTTPTNPKLSYTSLNTLVATVDANGWVTAKAAGTTKISVSTTDGSDITEYVDVTVTDPNIPVTSITVSPASKTLTIGATGTGTTQTLTSYILPSNAGAANKVVKYYSSDSNVATVLVDSGLITAVGAGTATITAVTGDGKTDTCAITVNQKVTSITLSPSTTSTTPFILTSITTTRQINATVTPDFATTKTLTYTSSDTSIATVSATGLVTRVASGTVGTVVTITVTAQDGSGVAGECYVKLQ